MFNNLFLKVAEYIRITKKGHSLFKLELQII